VNVKFNFLNPGRETCSQLWTKPFGSSDMHGYMGNEGPAKDSVYSRYAVVAWPVKERLENALKFINLTVSAFVAPSRGRAVVGTEIRTCIAAPLVPGSGVEGLTVDRKLETNSTASCVGFGSCVGFNSATSARKAIFPAVKIPSRGRAVVGTEIQTCIAAPLVPGSGVEVPPSLAAMLVLPAFPVP
jgi:hypothetical protein